MRLIFDPIKMLIVSSGDSRHVTNHSLLAQMIQVRSGQCVQSRQPPVVITSDQVVLVRGQR